MQDDDTTSRPTRTNDSPVEADIAANTASERLFEDLLNKYYIPLEVWYTRTIVDKVIRSKGRSHFF